MRYSNYYSFSLIIYRLAFCMVLVSQGLSVQSKPSRFLPGYFVQMPICPSLTAGWRSLWSRFFWLKLDLVLFGLHFYIFNSTNEITVLINNVYGLLRVFYFFSTGHTHLLVRAEAKAFRLGVMLLKPVAAVWVSKGCFARAGIKRT